MANYDLDIFKPRGQPLTAPMAITVDLILVMDER